MIQHLVLGAALVLASTGACDRSSSGSGSKGSAMTHSNAEGLWQQAREVPAATAAGKSLSDTYTFAYAGDLVTLRVLVLSDADWASADGVYKLQARWDGDELLYRAPGGQWTALAAFEDGKFVMYGDGVKREYARIEPAQIAAFSKAILVPDRPAFDYALTK